MADHDERTLTGAESEVGTRQFIRLFEAERAAAIAQFRRHLPEHGIAGKLLQELNKSERYDIVLAVTESILVDGAISELVIAERARALTKIGSQRDALDLLDRMGALRSRDYALHYAAGRVLADVRLPREALRFFMLAFAIKPTALAAERIFLCHMALDQDREAVASMATILRVGNFRAGLGEDFAILLRRVPPGGLDPELAFALASVPAAGDAVADALLPHLVASDLLDCVLTAVDRDIAKFARWNETTVLSLVPYLFERNKIDHLLRIFQQYDGTTPQIEDAFACVLNDMPAQQKSRFLLPDLDGFAFQGDDAPIYQSIAAHFSSSADAGDALEILRLLPAIIRKDEAQRFYAREKHRLARLAALAAGEIDVQGDATRTLAEFIAFCVDEPLREFFTSPDFEDLKDAIAASKALEIAPDNSRLGRFREGYFPYYLERRSDLDLDSLTNDFQLCDVALEYFSTLGGQRFVASVPVGRALSERLGRPALSLGAGRPLNVLSSFAILQGRPAISLERADSYDEFCWWYLTAVFGAGKIPPGCMQPDIVAYLNETISARGFGGLGVTRFLRLAWSKSEAYRKRFDLSNPIDCFLFVINLIASVLPGNTQFLPLFEPFIAPTAKSGQMGLLELIPALLAGPSGSDLTVSPRVTLMDAAHGAMRALSAVYDKDAPQDVLLVGHASKDTGLGRNFEMLMQALTQKGLAVTGLDFDTRSDALRTELKQWRAQCRSYPIVVFAVNAQDVPEFIARDRDGILGDCYTVGFFLWEVSRMPRVQELGVALVDEIWSPTTYVAEIYAAATQTHVVGKGLFQGSEIRPSRAKPAGKTRFTFLTVFDFDSSIERKNPLAAVRAFQKAFVSGEDAALIVKCSNVNPQHWSNASRHWERVLEACAGDGRITFVTERYSAAEMTALLARAQCVVSLHRSEGFGYLIADAMALGTPVIATNYSGNADFCSPETFYPVPYRLVPVPPGAARWRCDGAEWADADIDAAAAQMRHVFQNYDEALALADHAYANIVGKYSVTAFRRSLLARINAIRARTI